MGPSQYATQSRFYEIVRVSFASTTEQRERQLRVEVLFLHDVVGHGKLSVIVWTKM